MYMKPRSTLSKFLADTKGSLSVEAVFAVPLLMLGIIATFTFFDVFKTQNATYRANYTVSDMLSRQTDMIDADYLAGMYKVFKYMTRASNSNSWMRVSVVTCTSKCADPDRVLQWDWSHGMNGSIDLTPADLPAYESIIPKFAFGDRLILVETQQDYSPPFPHFFTAFGVQNLQSEVVTRPRFAPQLLYDTGSTETGYVAGDDSPPGGA